MKSSRPPRASAPPISHAPPRLQRVAERYVVQEELATGGMGVVYRVIDRKSGEERALKRIKPAVAESRFFVEAFQREYHVLAGLNHPRIIEVFDYGVDELGPYYTMELLRGEDMRELAPVDFRTACEYLRDIATSLSLLHARRLVHRDLSPANVRRTLDGHCKLFDFGALTSFGCQHEIVGTAPGVPPEAYFGGVLDQRADLYALGALAYFMLTKQHAYPAQSLDELEARWAVPPAAPSHWVPGIPGELDDLVLSLLRADPLGRPSSAAEVIARLQVIGGLPEEDEGVAERLAESFFVQPRFTGRNYELNELVERAKAALRGHGSAWHLEATAGMGRTRLLEELSLKAQILGATVLRIDASMVRQASGVVRALAVRSFDAFPSVARACAQGFRQPLLALGRELEGHLGTSPSVPPVAANGVPTASPAGDGGAGLAHFFIELSSKRPLVVLVDNVEHADDVSLGLLATLAKLSTDAHLLLVVTERITPDRRKAMGLDALRTICEPMTLFGLSSEETLEFLRSLFGEVPNMSRFAEWLYGRTAGSPLHCLEISRQLVRREVIRHLGGMWILPENRPDAGLPAELEDALAMRLDNLSEGARRLVECLSLQREEPTFELCRLLSGEVEDRPALVLLNELARNDVLLSDSDGYRFSSSALRDAVLNGMDEIGLELHHRRLGLALETLAGEDLSHRIEAGFHLIQGGDEIGGADLIASATVDVIATQTLIADLHFVGKPIERALIAYKRHRRSVYERAPLLAALAHAAYYEDRAWGLRYGDEALDTLERLTGVGLARRLQKFMGGFLAILVGLAVAFVRFHLVPKAERPYPFMQLLVQLFGSATTLAGSAILSLDTERTARVADVLKPFSYLPKQFAPHGIHAFCRGIEQIGRENQAAAFDTFCELAEAFARRPGYILLPPEGHDLYTVGCHFARGVFATYRSDGRYALESAAILEASNLKLYAMIASELRFLHHINRGELAAAMLHREQVELHAAQVGSAWQVELWEAAALLPVHIMLLDVVELARLRQRLRVSSQIEPSLKLYARLADAAVAMAGHGPLDSSVEALIAAIDEREPRSFIGWAMSYAFLAYRYNQQGDHTRAKEICQHVMSHITEADLDYVSMFVFVHIQYAEADAGLRDFDGAAKHMDGLLAHYRDVDHPLLMGSLHETRARIAWLAGDDIGYQKHLAKTERWFRPTGTPGLIAKCERLLALETLSYGSEGRQLRPAASSVRKDLHAASSTRHAVVAESGENTVASAPRSRSGVKLPDTSATQVDRSRR